MTTHWIISIGRPKLAVMSGKAMLTALSSGTTEGPNPINASRGQYRNGIRDRAATPGPIAAGGGCRARRLREKNHIAARSDTKIRDPSDAYIPASAHFSRVHLTVTCIQIQRKSRVLLPNRPTAHQ